VQLLTFHLAQERYALDLEEVRNVLPAVAVTPLPEAPDIIAGVVNVRGQILPVADLRQRLGHAQAHMELNHRLVWVMPAQRNLLLWVDAVDGVQYCDEEDCLAAAQLPYASDMFKTLVRLPDGLLLIHNLVAILDHEDERALTDALNHASNHTNAI